MDGQGLQRRKDSEVHLRENCASCLMSGGVRCHTLARSLHVPPPHFTFRRLLHFTFTPIASSNVYAHCKARISPGLILVSPCLQFRDLLKTSSLTLTLSCITSIVRPRGSGSLTRRQESSNGSQNEGRIFSGSSDPALDLRRPSSVPCGG